jgi:hypothetical protein
MALVYHRHVRHLRSFSQVARRQRCLCCASVRDSRDACPHGGSNILPARSTDEEKQRKMNKLAQDYVNHIKECWVHASVSPGLFVVTVF